MRGSQGVRRNGEVDETPAEELTVGKEDWCFELADSAPGAGDATMSLPRCRISTDVTYVLRLTWMILRGFGILFETRTSGSH